MEENDSIELNKCGVSYQSKMTLKTRALAEFMFEVTSDKEDRGKWLLYVDSFTTYAGSGTGVVLTSQKEDELEFALRYDFKASINKPEYEALVVRIKMDLDASPIGDQPGGGSTWIGGKASSTTYRKEPFLLMNIRQAA
ncbi:UNVERIFIED_CONTAM: hypothetical protein Sradi_0811600 [Sesamum radiatum]|uniref:Uncharacterized protein n=1 Tax=Sesamum radiatum TaxID=300843 RepID=A0AAW2VRY0_SESRA